MTEVNSPIIKETSIMHFLKDPPMYNVNNYENSLVNLENW